MILCTRKNSSLEMSNCIQFVTKAQLCRVEETKSCFIARFSAKTCVNGITVTTKS